MSREGGSPPGFGHPAPVKGARRPDRRTDRPPSNRTGTRSPAVTHGVRRSRRSMGKRTVRILRRPHPDRREILGRDRPPTRERTRCPRPSRGEPFRRRRAVERPSPATGERSRVCGLRCGSSHGPTGSVTDRSAAEHAPGGDCGRRGGPRHGCGVRRARGSSPSIPRSVLDARRRTGGRRPKRVRWSPTRAASTRTTPTTGAGSVPVVATSRTRRHRSGDAARRREPWRATTTRPRVASGSDERTDGRTLLRDSR